MSLLSFDQWVKRYKPVANAITPDAPWDGMMFETYDADLMHVLLHANGHMGKAGRRKVWTLVEGDDGEPAIVEGYHRVNRIGYFITAKPARTGVTYAISL
jgi:hypothetical protein